MKQRTRKSYWFLPIALVFLFTIAGCVRPAPTPDATETPASAPVPDTVVDPTVVISTPIPDGGQSYPDPNTDGTEPTPDTGTTPEEEAVDAPTAVPPGQPTTHTVQDGDTLSSISQQYGVPLEAIAAANNITTSSALTAGQALVIPAAEVVTTPPDQSTQQPIAGERVHVVQPGENLFRISLGYGKTVEEVAAYNGITNPHYIYPGQVIRIP